MGRDALVEAARQALKTRSPAEITLAVIAQIAGVDRALIRYYFGSLDELLAAAAVEITKDLRARLAALINQRGSSRSRLERRIEVYLDIFRDNPNYHRLVVDHVYRRDSEDKRIVLRLLRQSVDELDELLREGVQSGEFRAVDQRLVQIAIGAMCEFFFSAHPVVQAILVPGGEATPADFARSVATLIVGPKERERHSRSRS
ncbi:MAG: TetR family transcriptional regulator [Proteobacteria bacterium]|nr:TetR family transcriptional regulator [Pseudomonadota bacterium]